MNKRIAILFVLMFGLTCSATAQQSIYNPGVVSIGTLTGIISVQGNGTKVQLSTGSVGSGNCAKFDANGNVVDQGAVCGTSTLTNGAGSNVIPKSNGTNLVASSLSDNSTTVSTTEKFTTSQTIGVDGSGANALQGINMPNGDCVAVQGGCVFTLSAGLVTAYNAITTVDQGIPSEVGVAARDQTGLTAALSATTICTPSATGRFRVSVYEKVTTAASVSSILGGATGTVLTYTDGTDSVPQSITMGLDSQGGTVALTNSGNSTTTSLNGSSFIYAKTAVAIQVAVGYTSSGTAMAYQIRATCEAL